MMGAQCAMLLRCSNLGMATAVAKRTSSITGLGNHTRIAVSQQQTKHKLLLRVDYSKATIVRSMSSPSNMYGYPCLSVLSQLAFIDSKYAASFPIYPSQWKIKSTSTLTPTRDLRLDRPYFGARSFSTRRLTTLAQAQAQTQDQDKPIRIGIIGGGIAGVTVAHSLARRLPAIAANAEIVVFEGDVQEAVPGKSPAWTAATARNANSLVPGAAMHVFSRQNVLLQVLGDSARDWYFQQQETVRRLLPASSKVLQAGVIPLVDDHALFDTVPPYFALHLVRCLGPSADAAERWSFVRFVLQFVYSAMWLGDNAADERGRVMCQLAQVRHSSLECVLASSVFIY
jgi:hypothetical protein